MNFIDKALADKLTGDDFLQAMAAIYSESEVRDILSDYPAFIADVITIIDYDTALNMDGLSDIITDYGNSQDQLDAILTALEHCGLTDEADILREAKALWDTDEDQYEETYSDFSDRLVLFSDSDRFWDCVRAYIDANLTQNQ